MGLKFIKAYMYAYRQIDDGRIPIKIIQILSRIVIFIYCIPQQQRMALQFVPIRARNQLWHRNKFYCMWFCPISNAIIRYRKRMCTSYFLTIGHCKVSRRWIDLIGSPSPIGESQLCAEGPSGTDSRATFNDINNCTVTLERIRLCLQIITLGHVMFILDYLNYIKVLIMIETVVKELGIIKS